MERVVIRFQEVFFSYGNGDRVLQGLNAEIGPGLTLLLGQNGCGKSTLLKLAAGVEAPDRGRVEIDGEDLWEREIEARWSLAYVPEQPDLTPYATIREILDLVCDLRGEPQERGEEALGFVGLLDLSHRSVRELSMGQRRRAVLAAALVGSPRHVLLDEPLETMDRGARESILAWVDGLLAAGVSVVVVSHDLEPFSARASRALTIRDGRCRCFDALPATPGERMRLLEALARGQSLDGGSQHEHG